MLTMTFMLSFRMVLLLWRSALLLCVHPLFLLVYAARP
jgi:hypothetical protein